MRRGLEELYIEKLDTIGKFYVDRTLAGCDSILINVIHYEQGQICS